MKIYKRSRNAGETWRFFIPETTIFDDDHTDIYKKVDFCKCGVIASSAIRDKIIAVVYKEGDETFDYRSKG